MKFEHIHASGRFSVPAATLGRAIDDYLSDQGVRLVTLTEIANNNRANEARKVGAKRGFGFINGNRGGMDDCGILYNKLMFTVDESGTFPLSNKTYDAPGGGKTYAAAAILETVGKDRLLVVVAHMPSSVERGGGFKGARSRVVKWRADQKELKALWNRLAKQWGATAIIVTCDWNVNIKRRYFQQRMKALQPGMKYALNFKRLPKAGTLGKRLIDFSLIRGNIRVVERPQIMAKNSSSDHRPFRQSFDI